MNKNLDKTLENKALSLTVNHYENFPVASFLIPKYYRKDIEIVYWFARTADDIADEGNINENERLRNLDNFEKELTLALNDESNNKYFLALKQTIDKRNLSTQNFFVLLSAFKQDVIKKRYNNFNEVLDYCKRSANPVGRIVLEIYGIRDENANKFSDNICTALQLTNFYQDTLVDFEKGRIYYPTDEMKKFGVTENMFNLQENNLNISDLVKHNVDRAGLLFNEGKNLFSYLTGKLKIEIKWTVAGGEKILSKIRENNYNIFCERPRLSKTDFFYILLKNIF